MVLWLLPLRERLCIYWASLSPAVVSLQRLTLGLPNQYKSKPLSRQYSVFSNVTMHSSNTIPALASGPDWIPCKSCDDYVRRGDKCEKCGTQNWEWLVFHRFKRRGDVNFNLRAKRVSIFGHVARKANQFVRWTWYHLRASHYFTTCQSGGHTKLPHVTSRRLKNDRHSTQLAVTDNTPCILVCPLISDSYTAHSLDLKLDVIDRRNRIRGHVIGWPASSVLNMCLVTIK